MGEVLELDAQRPYRVQRERCRACANDWTSVQDARRPLYDTTECPKCGEMQAEPFALTVFADNGTGMDVPVLSGHQTLDAWRPRKDEIVLIQLGDQYFAFALPVATVLAERLNAALRGER